MFRAETTLSLFVHFKCSEERKRERLCIVRVVFRFEAVITLMIIAGLNMFLEWFQTRSDDVSPGRLQPGISRG